MNGKVLRGGAQLSSGERVEANGARRRLRRVCRLLPRARLRSLRLKPLLVAFQRLHSLRLLAPSLSLERLLLQPQRLQAFDLLALPLQLERLLLPPQRLHTCSLLALPLQLEPLFTPHRLRAGRLFAPPFSLELPLCLPQRLRTRRLPLSCGCLRQTDERPQRYDDCGEPREYNVDKSSSALRSSLLTCDASSSWTISV